MIVESDLSDLPGFREANLAGRLYVFFSPLECIYRISSG